MANVESVAAQSAVRGVSVAALAAALVLSSLGTSAVAAQPASAPGARPAPESARDPGQAQPPRQQRPVVSYDVNVALVEVDAVVTGADGRVIRDLRADEFQVLEDGVPQTVDRVSFIEIPIAQRQEREVATPVVPSDVGTNQQRFDGRLYVLLLDDLHTATSRTERVKAAARRFIEEDLSPGDLAAVAYAGRAGEGQSFTPDKQLLLQAVARFSTRQMRSETLNMIDRYQSQVLSTGRTPDPEQIRDPDEPARADDARVVFDAIASIARQLEPVRGRRKAVIWFGEGLSYNLFDARGRTQASMVLQSERDAVAAAGRANVAVYGVDARGLEGLGQETMQLSNVTDPMTGFDSSRLAKELARSQDNLRQVSAETGGFAIVNTEQFARGFEQVVAETSAYYLLGYYPRNEKSEGAYRSLEVRVSRPGAHVRARRGYTFTPRGRSAAAGPALANVPESLRDAMAGPVPRTGLPMAVHAAAFRGQGDKASVLVTIEYAASAFSGRPPGAAEDRLQTSVVALDTAGKVQASDNTSVDLHVKPETERAMGLLGFRTHARMELAPGRYELRVGAVVTSTGLNGSVYRDLEVPDFTARGLQMSGVELTCVVGAYTPTARRDERMQAVLPAPPTTMRDFRNDDQLGVFAEVYEAGRVPEQDVMFTTSVRRPDGRVVVERDEVATAGALQQSGGGYAAQLPLRGLAPGEYVLRLEAAAPGLEPVGRDVSFGVWAPEGSTP